MRCQCSTQLFDRQLTVPHTSLHLQTVSLRTLTTGAHLAHLEVDEVQPQLTHARLHLHLQTTLG